MDAFTDNILGVEDLIGSDTNKVHRSDESPEGASGETYDILDLPKSDEELLRLRKDWENAYAPYEGRYKEIPKRNLRSYLGVDKAGKLIGELEGGAANLQFEAEETFLPAALAENPDPIVYADNTPQGTKLSDDITTMLQFHAQTLLLRRKLEVMTRQWSIYHLGVLKPGWDEKVKDVTIENRKIQDFIFDPEGYVDVYGDFTSWLGERITVTAEKLIELFPKHKEYIEKSVMGEGDKPQLGTKCTYTQWWNDDYSFTTYKKKVLEKHKNEYFNYEEEPEVDPMTGQPTPPKRNHFAQPKKPYIFLSVFSLQEQPHDITGLIEQNIANQQKISRRTEQIDEGVSAANNGLLLSEDNFNQETGKQAVNAIRTKTGFILVPSGKSLGEAVMRLQAPNMPESAFKDLENSENHLRSSWGIQGIASQQAEPDETARGMILNQGKDTSRIGGGISDVLEQSVSKACYDWLVQLYCVFYDVKHFGAVMGTGQATEYVELSAQDIDRQLIVGVAKNSMMPKDPTSIANQAIQLFSEKAIGPKTLLEKLNFPDADGAAADGALWATDPSLYIQLNFPELAQQMQQIAQQQQQAQAQAQQQQMQQEAQSGQQQLQQKAQAGQQQLQQGEASHAQQLKQQAESHAQKMQQSTEAASAKMAQMKSSMPK
jgi:hypothetical protein